MADWRDLVAGQSDPGTPLALGVELRQRVRHDPAGWAPKRFETATPRSLAASTADVVLALRPLEPGTRAGSWVKGRVSWDALRRPGSGYAGAGARWLLELHSLARDTRTLGSMPDGAEWLLLDDAESSLLWAHLARAEAAGVAVVPTDRRQRLELAAAASAQLHVVRRDGGYLLEPRVTIDAVPVDAARVRPIGRVGVYAFPTVGSSIELVLAPLVLAEPVRAALAAGAPVAVPAADAAEFARDHLPHIARVAAVTAGAGVVLPDPTRPRVIVRVGFEPSHRLTYALSWRYPGIDDLPFAATTVDVRRDSDAEEALRTVLARTWEDASDTPFASRGVLTGIEAAEFATGLLPALEALRDVVVEIHGTRPAYRELTADPRVSISTVETDSPDWFDLGVIVTVEGRRIPFSTLFSALAKGRKKLLLSDGAYFSLSHPALQRLRELIDESGTLDEWEPDSLRISRHQTDFWDDFEDLADEAVPAVSWRATLDGLRDLDALAPAPRPAGLRAELRPYQRAGYDWLWFLWSHRLGGILADDMGLGKTLQALALMIAARETGERRPFLVVAPTSVMGTWQEEAARFAPELTVRVVSSTAGARGDAVTDAAAAASVVITTYAMLRLNEQEFAGIAWAAVVLDEAQFVKNHTTKTHRAAAALRADAVFALTGTPLENSLSELRAILALTDPGLFPSARRFREEYVQPIEEGRVPENAEGGAYRARRLGRLRRRIRPFLLRRTKESVAAELPPTQEQEVRVELGAAHRALYDAVLQRERQKVLGLLADLDRNRFIVFRSLTLLRMLSLSPALIDSAHAGIASAKVTALFEQLDEVVAEGHRALVFSQFTSFLHLVAAEFDRRGIAYAYLDGSTRDRAAVIDGFRSGDAPVFLISLKAGGFGLTLTEADYVFLLDPWWNPAAEAQAVDRAHRIGQTRSVMVYRLIAAGTIEEKVLALQQRKARLFTAVLDDDAMFAEAVTADDIRSLFEG